DGTALLRIGSRMVRREDRPDLILAEAPVDRSGRLYVRARDAARLLGLAAVVAGTTVALARPVQLGSAPRFAELAAPPSPRPKPTPRSAASTSMAATASSASAGLVLLSLDRSAGTSVLTFAGDTHGGNVSTSIGATGINGLGMPTGTVTIGTKDRNVQLGAFADPLGGLVLRGTIENGVDLYDAGSRRDYFAGRRLSDGRSEAGVVMGAGTGAGADVLVTLLRDGAYDRTIFRRIRVEHEAWGDFSREVVLSDRGIGGGFAARTRGRTFVESSVAFATPGLRLSADDAPVSIDIGRELSSQTTIAGGLVTGPDRPVQPFAAFTTRGRDLVATLSATAHDVTAGLAYQSGGVFAQVYTVPGPQRSSGATASVRLARATIEANLTSSVGVRDASVELRTVHPGIGLIAGFGAPGGRWGPIAGLSIPVSSALRLEATTRPGGANSSRLHLALAVGIAARRPKGVPTLRAVVRVDSAFAPQPLRLFVDGVPVSRFDGATTTVDVTHGAHTFAVETVSGDAGSVDVAANVEAAGDSVALVLWPERVVTGRVVLDRAAAMPPDFTLAGIGITIAPGGPATETSADGTFVFAKQPVPPNATIAVDAGTLPRALRADEPARLAPGDVTLVLRPGMLLETKTFRSP
ncbi:MAG: hypothetical protein QOD51_2297, partial [Candidatus Eremiobacteraeota bacterium]|nr:hypothetical protein [Candidatus Eremiobacteraeota bacterium]